jgi:hypothetical protein
MGESETPRDSSGRIQIIIALIGLAGVVATALFANWNNIFPRKTAQPAPAATPASTAGSGSGKKSERPVRSSGRLMVRGTYTYDLDSGSETTAGADFQWRQETNVLRSITSMNGAAFFVVGAKEFESIRWSDMEHFPYSPAPIDGSANASNRIPAGTVVAYKTSEGHLGKFIVDEYGYNLTIRWRTYD